MKLMKMLVKTSSNLYLYWNIGSIMMMIMFIQILLGFLLSMHYFSMSNNMFMNSFMIFFNFNYGWMMRFFHSNLTSLIFILMFMHITRSLIYMNHKNKKMWNSGILMLLLLMMISFLGYSLINSQMSFWAMTVITNFLSIIPIMGNKMMLLIWGNKFINNILINRFFSIHFVSTLLIMFMSLIHVMILHMKKSSNPLNINNKIDQINLNPLLIFKDLIFMMIMMFMFMMLNMLFPKMMNNPDNFNQMMMFKTPSHIEPEWYFLMFYAILRSNENKFNGLMMMLLSIIIWLIIPYINNTKFMSNKFFILNKISLSLIILIMMLMTFIGSKPSKLPYIMIMKFLIMMYFIMFMKMFYMNKLMN